MILTIYAISMTVATMLLVGYCRMQHTDANSNKSTDTVEPTINRLEVVTTFKETEQLNVQVSVSSSALAVISEDAVTELLCKELSKQLADYIYIEKEKDIISFDTVYTASLNVVKK